ncbi:MAG TPA: bifunctional 4-hydroxy-2-oxoglutarate aldolase/2-dehydro-3-deoxy-phosphogluconate aldolase [Dinghuibacter sp.]|uniref:bifunctional 4-hydroxy-2-oxoglutarate aldolase/2-dehydro-3-deoxy-phosphogluconate aldolase n=1 Tax=Dinghuibacter sp. TaxID=2024697 RepID=UPI002CAD43C0|nr:bifunctional 4-hydroxy-2-oxoglutarate aldolase/2-dehydro-3-deoxy-phosphogluconate aldolase [Dinghuibacter sp.]HTJ11974.1 bifunctional 4-hydroxy-2-oxoglutarate aldolase/2-dehydro-3-deoxy-phosphogluconate aldolase [Dinghuibacter sp.]
MSSPLFGHRLVAIVRGALPSDFPSILSALYEGGVRAVEVTLNSPDALSLLAAASSFWGDRLLLGAGTVMDAASVDAAVASGARFIISPHLDPLVVAATLSAGIISIPGAYTPTEIVTAHRLGAHIVKVFPASVGPSYLRDLRGPLPHIPLMPTGGVTLSNIKAFSQAGAVAFGVGSALVDTSGPIDFSALRARAAEFVEAVTL